MPSRTSFHNVKIRDRSRTPVDARSVVGQPAGDAILRDRGSRRRSCCTMQLTSFISAMMRLWASLNPRAASFSVRAHDLKAMISKLCAREHASLDPVDPDDPAALAWGFRLVIHSRSTSRTTATIDCGARKRRLGGSTMKTVPVSRRVFLKSSKASAAWLALVARHHRAGAGCHHQTQIVVVAAQRRQICQRPGLLRQPGQEPEGERARRDRSRSRSSPTTSSARKSMSSIPSSSG